ncbi:MULTISPECIES: PPOX class F420-dependent oxidoreductase [unclassified Streptomyces]|uniref:PPOX class F420-dependent oxidoreductase n=1 Tax=unclassified Streptomyces TaxID=2593676 RepID=UPI002DD9B891|nr:PPOX class F420-dependent oxidoreductase [Streptomyces sp. NBC_01445]WSE09978.1 PPOX class F420-dependent oxidoreductase [Streptomyces sp. NBC_01445]
MAYEAGAVLADAIALAQEWGTLDAQGETRTVVAEGREVLIGWVLRRHTRKLPDMTLPSELTEAMGGPAICFLTTLMPDGSPQITQTWVDTDGEHVVINTVTTHQKMKNIHRDPRVAVAIADPAEPSRYWAIRGRVISSTTEGAETHIDKVAHKYLGGPYPWFGGRDQERVILTIAADKVHSPRG